MNRMIRRNISSIILITSIITMFVMIGCGGGGGGSIDPIPVIPTNTPTSPNQPTVAPTPIKYGSIIGRVYLSDNVPLNNGYIVCKSFVVSEKSDDKSLLALLTSSSTPFTANTNTDPNGEFHFPSFPQGPGRIEAFKNLSDYQADPNAPIAAVNLSIIEETKGLELHQGEVEPTPLPTAIPTATNTVPPGSTPTNTPPPGSTPTNTPPAGATNTPTPAATNTATATPTATTAPSGNPSITSVTNSATGGSLAKDGDTLTIVGTNFGVTQGTVSINGTNANITGWTNTSITCTVATSSFKTNGPIVPFVVTRSDTQSASFDKMVLYQLTGNPYMTFATGAPVDVTFNSSGTEFTIADQGLSQIRSYTYSTKNPLNTNNSITAPNYISNCSANNKYYVSSGGYVYSLPSDLSSYSSFGGPPTMASVMDITYNTVLGKLFCVDYPGGAASPIHQYNTDGTGHSIFLSGSTTNHPLSGLTTDSSGNFYASSSDDDIVFKYNSTGTLLYQWSLKYGINICNTNSGLYTIVFSSCNSPLNQPAIGVSITDNGQCHSTSYITGLCSNPMGLDYNNHNLVIASTNPKGVYLIQF